ncbi:intermembrane lipid transfer protein Vps13-like isoform X2 [Ornithodoros turicata]|uniref:intermembrane lipid transfer protein Vps13-like isoform X2 n=1 Tax=Ornithodoros turicata TaxID=34597 RepID=UPI00313A0714
MVFESLVVELLNNVLGDYVENLDTSQLKLGIWGGDVNLKDLDIKQSAIDDFELPFRVSYGHIDKLTLKIPWKNLYGSPVSAVVEGVYVIIVPKSGIKYDPEKEKKLLKEAKQRELDRIELVKQKEAQKDNPKGEKQDTFMEKLTAQIIKNLQIRVKNIHIRYEDAFTIPKHPFSFGITLFNLSFDTTDENWDLCILDESVKLVHKLVNINSFAVYWNCNSEHFLGNEAWVTKNLLQERITTEVVKPKDISYVLGPISSVAKLKMNTKPETYLYSKPGITLDILVSEISIGLSKLQFRDIMALLESLNRLAIAAHYRKYRPNVPVHGNCKLWWHFAYEAILEEHVRRRRRNWSLKHMHAHVVRVKEYKEQYKLKLQSKESPEKLQALEDALDVFNITLARKQAELEVEELLLTSPKQGWLSSWWYGGQQPSTSTEGKDLVKQFEKAMTAAEKQKLYAAIDYQENSVPPDYPASYIERKLNFLLKNLSLSIHDESKCCVIIRVILDDMSASFEERPRGNAIKLESKIERFKVLGFPEKQSDFCTLISSEDAVTHVGKSLLTFLYETKPLDGACDERIHLFAEPVEMTFDSEAISALVEVFKPPEEVPLEQLHARAASRLRDFREMSATGLQHAIQERKALDLLVDLKPSYMLIYEGGRRRKGKHLLVVSFGQLFVHGVPRSRRAPTVSELVKSGSTEDEVMSAMILQAYDKYNIKLTATEVLICPPDKDWKPSLRSGKSDSHVLQPTDIIVDIQKSIVEDDARLPKVKVMGTLPLLRVSVTDFKLVQVLKVLNSIPSIGPSEPTIANAPSETTTVDRVEVQLPSEVPTDAALGVVPKGEESEPSEAAVRDIHEQTDVELNFEVTEVVLEICQTNEQKPKELKPVLIFQAHYICLKLEVHPLDMVCQLCLKKAILQHMDFKAPGEEGPLRILDSTEDPGTGNTISILYVQTNKKHPDFAGIRNSVLQRASLDVSELVLVLHEQSISALMSLANNMSEQLGHVGQESKVVATQEQVQQQVPQPHGTKVQAAVGKREAKEIISMDIFATLSGFAVAICNQKRTVCDILIRGMEAGLTIYSARTVLKMNLKTVGIYDPTPGTVHKNILALAGDEVLDLVITTYEESGSEGYVTMDKVDVSVKGTFGRMHFVFLYKFYLDIMNFVDKFQTAKQKIAEASVTMAEAARAGVELAYQKAYKMALDICIEAPIFYLPQNSKSRNIVVADFGVLHVWNKFYLAEHSRRESPILLEDMVIEFDKLKLSRFTMKIPSHDDDVEFPLLEPVTFKMNMTRNMNFSTHPEVPEMKMSGLLPKLDFMLSEEDYCAIMRILDENMNEVPQDVVVPPYATPPPLPQQSYSTEGKSSRERMDTNRELNLDGGVKRAIRIDLSFQIDSLILNLYAKRSKKVTEGLARLEILVLSLKGNMFHDGSFWMDTVLWNLIVDDTRACRKKGLTRFLTKSSKNNEKLVDVLYKVDPAGDFFCQTTISRIMFVYCVDFFNAFMRFYNLDNMYEQAKEKEQRLSAKKQAQVSVPTATDTTSPAMPPYPVRNYTVLLEMARPDIVLVADIEDVQSPCIILKSSIHVKMRQVATTQTMSVTMEDLKMYTSSVDSLLEEHVLSEILKPTMISLNSTYTVENGQHMEVTTSPIEIHIIPGAVEILSKSFSALSAPGPEVQSGQIVEPNNLGVWNVTALDKSKLWYLEEEAVKVGTDALEAQEIAPQETPAACKDEQALLTAKSIVVTVEQGSDNRTIPMLLWRASLEAEVLDWSSEMSIRGFLGSVISYYNEKLAVWEPLVEPLEVPGGRKAWEIALKVDRHFVGEEEQDSAHLPPMYSIEVLVEDALEVTITKTAIQVVQDLGVAFGEAMSHTTCDHKRLESPYVVKNFYGIPVHIILEGTNFLVAAPDADDDIDEVILEPEAVVHLSFRESTVGEEDRTRPGLIELNQQTLQEANFAVEIEEGGVSAVRKVCVTYADKRYFKLPITSYPGDEWAFIVDTTSHYGSKLVMVYSVCKITNHFSVPIEVYYLSELDDMSTELHRCGCIEPHKILHVPVHALYTKTSELFFKPAGDKYNVSIDPFVWKTLSDEPSQNRVLQCLSKSQKDHYFFINVSGKAEPVRFDESSGKEQNMHLYNIELHPTVLVRNLLPCGLYVKLESMTKTFLLEAGQGVELWNAEIGESNLQLKLMGYRDMDWSCTKLLEACMEELSVVTFETPDGSQMDLGMHVETNNSCVIIGMYCPFWMVNKTTVDIHYKPGGHRSVSLMSQTSFEYDTEDSMGIPHPATYEEPVLFSYRSKTLFTRKKAAVKLFNSEWSEKFSLDAVGSSGTVIAKSKDGETYLLSVGITLSTTGLTRIVTFTPYYLVLNNCKFAIEVKEYVENTDWITIQPEECIPLWPKQAQKLEMMARYAGTLESTVPFSCKETNSVLLKLANKKGGIYMSCHVTESAAVVTFCDYEDGLSPVLLVNHSSCRISYCQLGYKDTNTYFLPSKCVVHYTWDNPMAKRSLTWGTEENPKFSKLDLLMDDCDQVDFEGRKLFWIAFLNGKQRTVLFTEDPQIVVKIQESGALERNIYDVALSVHGVGVSLVNDNPKREIVYMSIVGSGVKWEWKKEHKTIFKPMPSKETPLVEAQYQQYQNLCKLGRNPQTEYPVAGYMVNFQDMKANTEPRRDVRRLARPGIWCQYKMSKHQSMIHARLHMLQVDNQIPDCTFPVILTPVIIRRSLGEGMIPKPFIETSIIIRQFDYSQVRQFKYFKVLIQEFHIRIDQCFVNSLTSFTSINEKDTDHEQLIDQDKLKVKVNLKEVSEQFSEQGTKDFFDMLHFSPLKVHLSFSLSTGGKESSGSPLFNLLLQSFGVTLTEIQDAVLKLDYFEKSNAYLSMNQLVNEAVSHYTRQTLKQIYVVVLGLDVIGNPVGLLMGFTTGVGDLFYEPLQGAIQGPEEFAEGLAVGVRSLIGHTVGGAAGAVSRITGTIGKGIAALTMDEEYQRRRRLEQNRRPNDIAEGIAQGGRDFVMGVYEGVTGIVTKPVAGAREEGISGFFKGVGKGLIGAVARPTAGVVDFASGSFDAVKRATDVVNEVFPVRPARFIRPDGIIRPYNLMEAQGNRLLQDVDKGKFAETDVYIAHLNICEEGKNVLLVTNKRIMFILRGDVFGQWNSEWNYPWDDVKEVPTLTDKGIKVLLKEPKKKALFGSKESGKIIHVKDKIAAKHILHKIEEVMKKPM